MAVYRVGATIEVEVDVIAPDSRAARRAVADTLRNSMRSSRWHFGGRMLDRDHEGRCTVYGEPVTITGHSIR